MSGKASVVHLKKKNGKIVNEYDVYIGRKINNKYWQLPQSKFCNPFSIRQYEMKGMNKEAARKASIKAYKKYLEKNTFLKAHLFELVGKRLGCWCAPKPCHGDVLVEYVNKMQQST